MSAATVGLLFNCSVYQDGNTCLHRASAVCDYDMIIWCLDHGVDKYAKNKVISVVVLVEITVYL